MTRFALTNCNNFLTPECAIKASKGCGQPFELRGYIGRFIGLVYRIDHPIERFIKKKKEEKRKIWNTNNLTNMYLRILWCRTGCESARQQSTYNLKREQFFFILLTICTIGTMMNQYLSFFSFLSNFCWTLFKWKKWSLVNRNYYWRQSC